ncbi:bestrophin family protein [Sphingomonas sp.]|uniref:bestrophin family protein n=1 Tax=Sphingomonas sp. TaxID=28214 RepID=UPI002CE48511|nr:bestrophin family ion channel [Sphingomonas sp.]HTG37754.1 bestrophin family ion channel [Sphingomonas sp.]
MIVNNTPRMSQIIIEVWKPLAVLFVWDVIVTAFYMTSSFRAPSLPLTIFGTVLALFLGFRVNSAYERWWEGRQLWGLMINASRNLARAAIAFLPDDPPRGRDLKRSIALRQIAYVNALRCQLRRLGECPEVYDLLSKDEADEAMGRVNAANGFLDGTAKRIEQARREGWIDTIQQTQMERILVDIANAQGGMERLKNTPLPMQYRFFPSFFARIFCLLLPIGLVETLGWATPVGSTLAGLMFLAALQIGDDLVDPFSNTVHDLPMNAMCRTIEIDLKQAIGDAAPEPAKPFKGVLW